LKINKIHTSFFLLLVAISFSINIHGLSHIDDSHNNENDATCELCVINKTEEKLCFGLVPEPILFSIEDLNGLENKKTLLSSRQIIPSKKLYKSDCFNKPPPTSIS